MTPADQRDARRNTRRMISNEHTAIPEKLYMLLGYCASRIACCAMHNAGCCCHNLKKFVIVVAKRNTLSYHNHDRHAEEIIFNQN